MAPRQSRGIEAARGTKRKEPEPEPPKQENEAHSLRQIIPDGDVILVVGPEKSKIQLSSHLLSSTSSVFKAMLGPNFREGALLREGQGPVEIALPEDNAEAVWNAYSALYGANPRAYRIKPDEVYDIAILAQKYDLIERLSLACERWFLDSEDGSFGSIDEDWKMLLAAYWLGSDFAFGKISQRLIEGREGSFYKYGMKTPDPVLGLKLCRKWSSYPPDS
ncbi:hypothetical protein ACHAPT_004235 [Fusarium lateritium]